MVPVEVLEGVMGRSFSAFFPWKLAKVDGDVPMETKDEGRVVSVELETTESCCRRGFCLLRLLFFGFCLFVFLNGYVSMETESEGHVVSVVESETAGDLAGCYEDATV